MVTSISPLQAWSSQPHSHRGNEGRGGHQLFTGRESQGHKEEAPQSEIRLEVKFLSSQPGRKRVQGKNEFEVPRIIPLARAALGLAGPVVWIAVGLGGSASPRAWRTGDGVCPPSPITMAANRQGSHASRAPSPLILGLTICVLAASHFMQRKEGGHEQPV